MKPANKKKDRGVVRKGATKPATRKLTIVAQDPHVRLTEDGSILTTQVTIPYEELGPGPKGYRVYVVDYDGAQGKLYEPADLAEEQKRFKSPSDKVILTNAAFHAQNVYAIVMKLLSRFEFALGRRVSWGFGGHQLYVAPHAFGDANAYYSEDAHGLLFGYFPSSRSNTEYKTVYTCLSHDVIAHESTHALLDGLRDCYTFPAGPDQAGLHEGFADIVALLSVFAQKDVVRAILLSADTESREESGSNGYIKKTAITKEWLRDNALTRFAEEFGEEVSNFSKRALRNAGTKEPDANLLKQPEYEECHLRGEVLAAAMMNSFLTVWNRRLKDWLKQIGKDAKIPADHVAEDGAEAAEQLLTMAIRALDYCPVVDMTFGDFLSALLTADREVLRDDGKYSYRKYIVEEFGRWGIRPISGSKRKADSPEIPEAGVWERPEFESDLNYDCIHLESLQHDRDEVFRFIWENRKALKIYEKAYTRVISVRPSMRITPDGFTVRETVSEYLQTHNLTAKELKAELSVSPPKGMSKDTPIRLYGGGVLIFDEFGRLKYHVRSRLDNRERQEARLAYLWDNGLWDEEWTSKEEGKVRRYGFSDGSPRGQRFAMMHLRRAGRIKRSEWNA